jgi:hypothetical protein
MNKRSIPVHFTEVIKGIDKNFCTRIDSIGREREQVVDQGV